MTARVDRQQIANQIRELAGEQVKALVLNWLAGTKGSLTDFERLLEAEYASTDDATLIYGELDEALNFQPLSSANPE